MRFTHFLRNSPVETNSVKSRREREKYPWDIFCMLKLVMKYKCLRSSGSLRIRTIVQIVSNDCKRPESLYSLGNLKSEFNTLQFHF